MNQLVIVLYEFILSGWIFSVSYDWFHLILNTFLLCIVFSVVARVSSGRAVLLSFSAHFFAFMIFALLAVSFFAYHVVVEFIPSEITEVGAARDILRAAFHVGFIYAVLQSVFIALLHIGSDLSLRRLLVAVWVSNLISASLSYFCIVTIMQRLA